MPADAMPADAVPADSVRAAGTEAVTVEPVVTQAVALAQRVGAHVRLARPLNAAISVAGVLVGAWLSVGAAAAGSGRVWTAALAAALLGGGANALNDSLDVAADRVNRPRRPIPSGGATVRSARALWLGLTALALVLAAIVSPWHAAVALASALVLAVYTPWLKPRVLVGNLAVAAVVAMAVVFGGRASGGVTEAVVAGAAFAFLTNLAREIVKDIEDAPGDALAGARTLPLVAGPRVAAGVAMAVVAFVLVALPVPVLRLGLSGSYTLVAVGVALALLAALRALVAGDASGASRALKAAMGAGLVALAVGAPA